MKTDVNKAETGELPESLARLRPQLTRFAYGLCGSRSEAEDLVQAAYERALARLHQWRTGTRLDSWMYRIVQSIWFNLNASREVRRRHEISSSAVDPQHVACDGEMSLMLETVRREIHALPDDQRAALLLVAVEGLSFREAAQTLEITQGTLSSRIGRARATLRARTRMWEDD